MSLLDYTYCSQLFRYDSFAQLTFPEWESMASEDDSQEMEGRVIVFFWKAIDQLIANNAFRCLQMHSPFRVGLELMDDPLTVLGILNWPS